MLTYAHVCSRMQDHYTALHLACRYNDTPDTVVALLDARADPTLLSRGGQPAALIAATLGDPSVLEAVSEVDLCVCVCVCVREREREERDREY